MGPAAAVPGGTDPVGASPLGSGLALGEDGDRRFTPVDDRVGGTIGPAAAQPTSSTSSRASASSSRTARRHASASAVRRPCLRAFRLPRGGPAQAPCILHRRLPLTAGDRHGLPDLVRAPQRGDRCMGKGLCMGLFVIF